MNRGCWKVDDDDKGHTHCDRIHKFVPKVWNDQYVQVKYKTKGTQSKKNNSPTLADCVVKYHSSINLPENAIYIDIEEDEDDANKEYSKWSELPDLLLEKIFSYLTIREKYYASLVCKSWYQAFHLPYVWSRFVLGDTTLTRGRYNYYSGWQYVLDHLRTQMCLSTVGRNFRHLTFEPMLNFYNLYEFMNMVSWYIEQSTKCNLPPEIVGVGGKIKSLKFTFPCNMANREESDRIRLFGTGGKLLAALKRLMANLKLLRRLELIDLMLDPKEAEHLLDEVCEFCCLTLHTLSIINATRVQYQILHVGVFLNIQVLIISPQNLGNDTVELIGYTKLKHLHIFQNRYTPSDLVIKPASERAWMTCRKNNPDLHVHLELESVKAKQMLWQDGAPVNSVLYNSPHIGVENDSVMTIIEMYRNDLKVYGHKSLPRGYRSRSFHERIDCSLLLLCRQCPKLTTLVVTERISTATVLLLAHSARRIRYFYIRRNAVIKRCDWPQSPEWSDDFYDWLRANSQSYEFVEREVSQILDCKWHMLSDKEFKQVELHLHSDKLY